MVEGWWKVRRVEAMLEAALLATSKAQPVAVVKGDGERLGVVGGAVPEQIYI